MGLVVHCMPVQYKRALFILSQECCNNEPTLSHPIYCQVKNSHKSTDVQQRNLSAQSQCLSFPSVSLHECISTVTGLFSEIKAVSDHEDTAKYSTFWFLGLISHLCYWGSCGCCFLSKTASMKVKAMCNFGYTKYTRCCTQYQIKFQTHLLIEFFKYMQHISEKQMSRIKKETF